MRAARPRSVSGARSCLAAVDFGDLLLDAGPVLAGEPGEVQEAPQLLLEGLPPVGVEGMDAGGEGVVDVPRQAVAVGVDESRGGRRLSAARERGRALVSSRGTVGDVTVEPVVGDPDPFEDRSCRSCGAMSGSAAMSRISRWSSVQPGWTKGWRSALTAASRWRFQAASRAWMRSRRAERRVPAGMVGPASAGAA